MRNMLFIQRSREYLPILIRDKGLGIKKGKKTPKNFLINTKTPYYKLDSGIGKLDELQIYFFLDKTFKNDKLLIMSKVVNNEIHYTIYTK